jgi:hypothetical protein
LREFLELILWILNYQKAYLIILGIITFIHY